MKFFNENLPLPTVFNNVCECECECDELAEKIANNTELIEKLRVYIHNLTHGLHFIGRGEEEPIVCSRLAFIKNN